MQVLEKTFMLVVVGCRVRKFAVQVCGIRGRVWKFFDVPVALQAREVQRPVTDGYQMWDGIDLYYRGVWGRRKGVSKTVRRGGQGVLRRHYCISFLVRRS